MSISVNHISKHFGAFAALDIYDHPANAFVSRFIGQTNIFDLDEHDADWLQTAGLLTSHQEGKIAHVRPHDIHHV